MMKMLKIVLTIAMSAGIVSAQDISGNYQLESLEVHYVMVTRDINQMGSDGNYYITDFDNALSSYGFNIGWPFAGADSHFDYQLPPSFSPGDTISELQVTLPSAAWLAGAGIALNADFTDGAYTINTGSTYPTTQTVDCITTQVIPSIQDNGTWTDGDFDPLVDDVNHTAKTGWGIITSAVFASFQAPDMVNHVYGTDYGVGTAMEDWGYIQTNYNDDWSQPTGLNIGWEAHDGPNAGIGIVSELDQYYNADEAALGLVNNVVGMAAIPGDSVTIAAMAYLGSMQTPPITINVPTGDSLGVTDHNRPYMLGGPGQVDANGAAVIDPETGAPVGLFNTSWGYIFDPTGDLLGGGDHIPFSGDEALQFTGYYVTWHVLMTINAIQEGTVAAMTAAAMAGQAATLDSISAYVIAEVMWQWDVADAVQEALNETASTALTAQLTDWVTAYMLAGMDQTTATTAALEAALPWALGLLTQYQAQLVDSEGNAIIIDDSDHDLDPDDYEEWTDYYDEYIGDTYPNGGRLFVEMYANCIPARWSQYIDSEWNYTGEIVVAVDDDGIVAEKFELKGNYPNPFNPTTKIRFSNDRTANVTVHVYSLKGERVATILNSQLNPGTYDVSWNGMNSSGKVVPSGMYLYEVRSEERSMQGKMLFLK
jgi:hypothetical protein